MKYFLIVASLLFIVSSCETKITNNQYSQITEQEESTPFSSEYNQVIVKEVIQVSGYTYLNVDENDQSRWLAVPTLEAKIGDKYFYKGGTPMKDFVSKTLNRTFNEIIFLGELRTESNINAKSTSMQDPRSSSQEEIKLDPLEGGITIGELMKNKDDYNQKDVRIRGKVVKYNGGIMKTNWIHIEDGTNYNGNVDLTITSDTEVKVGDIIIVKGTVILDKDFGSGYKYDIIIENASVSLDKRG